MTDTASTTSTSSTGGGEGGSKFCIICAGPASDKIVKDNNYQMIMDLYWKGIRVDVKPEMNKSFDLCLDCFDSVISFYQINDVLVYFESRLKELQRGILSTNLKGILRWQEKGFKLNKVQTEIMREWGTSMEPVEDVEAMKVIVDAYKVSESHENGTGSSSSSKRGSEDKESTEGKSSGQSERVERSPAAKRNKTHEKQKGGPKKKVRRVVRNLDTSDEESDGINFSDKVNVDLTMDDEVTKRGRSTRRPISEASTVTIGDLEKECRICLDKFASSSILQKHIRQHKVGENEGKYECRFCSQQFNRQAKLVDHKKTCKNDEDNGSTK